MSKLLGYRLVQHVLTLYRRKESVVRWVGRGFWAVADQSLFAVSNFALNILLARWLAPQDYGTFTVVWTVYLFLYTFYQALLTEPMLVFGPSRYEGRSSEYVSVLLYGHLVFTALGVLVLLLASLGFELSGSKSISLALLSLAPAMPFILFLWLMRQACYIRFQPHLAASGGTLYAAVILVMSYILFQGAWLSTASVISVMGIGSLIAGLWLAVRLHVGWSTMSSSKGLFGEVFEKHWRYGRWAAATHGVNFIPWNIFFLVLPIWGSLEATGALKAMWNLILPVLHVNAALSILLVPTLVQAREHNGFSRGTYVFLSLFTFNTALYWLLLGLFHRPLVMWLYDGQYSEHAALLWLLGLLPLTAGAALVLAGALRALERPDQVFWAYTFSAVVALTLGMLSTAVWGIIGAIVGSLFSHTAALGAMAWILITRSSKVERG